MKGGRCRRGPSTLATTHDDAQTDKCVYKRVVPHLVLRPTFLRHAPHAAQQHAKTTCQRNNVDRADLGCEFERELALGNYCSPAIKLTRRFCYHVDGDGRLPDGCKLPTVEEKNSCKGEGHAGALSCTTTKNCNSPRAGVHRSCSYRSRPSPIQMFTHPSAPDMHAPNQANSASAGVTTP